MIKTHHTPVLPSYFKLHSDVAGSLTLSFKGPHSRRSSNCGNQCRAVTHLRRRCWIYSNSLYRLKELHPWEEPGDYFIEPCRLTNEENSSKLVQEFAQWHKMTKQQTAGTGVCCLSGGRHSPTLGIDERSLGKTLSMASRSWSHRRQWQILGGVPFSFPEK